LLNLNQNLSFINNKFDNISLTKHFHEEYSFSLIYEGNHLYQNDTDRFNIKVGMIQVVNPYELHLTATSSWSYLNIMPTVELINDIAQHLTQNDKKYQLSFLPIIRDKVALRLYQNLFLSITHPSNHKVNIESSIIEFFEYIIIHHSSKDIGKIATITSTKKEIRKALEYINDFESIDDLSLDSISIQLGISKYHFLKEFKKHIGITPNKYIQIMKTNRSKKLIQDNISLSNVAYECGFTDQSYMIKIFKKYYGYTPSKLIF